MSPLRVATPRPAGSEMRVSFAQERIWFLQQFAPGSTVFNRPHFIQLTGLLDTAALERSLNTVMARHESLRTIFENRDGQPVPLVLPAQDRSLGIVDLGGLTPEQQQTEIARLQDAEIHQPFDLDTGPLLRFGLLRLGAKSHILWLTLHHIITDAWSSRIFNQELSALYNADVCHEAVSLPDLPIQYGDFAHWQRQWLEEGDFQKQLDYWQQQLRGELAVLDLAVDRPAYRDSQQTMGHRLQRSLSPTLLTSLKVLSRREKVTLFMTLLAAFDVLLYRYSGLTDILVGSTIANRNRAEIEPLIGFFVNTLVLRTDLSGTPTFREVLGRVRRVALEGFSNQDIPFEKLVQILHPERNTQYTPLFQVFINMVGERGRGYLHLHDLTTEFLAVPSDLTKFDLSLELWQSGDQMVCNWEYNTSLFDAPAIERMHGHFETLLQAVVEDPDVLISNVALLTTAERHQLLVEWNNTARPFSLEESLSALFEEQAQKTPDAPAFIFGKEQLTFSILNHRANQLAHYLSKRGAAAGQVVGVSTLPGFDMMIAVIAILKTGAAYLPLDPSYPAERLAYMAKDSAIRLLVTDGSVKELLLTQVQAVRPDHDADAISREPADNLQVPMGDIAYVLYTSGSTGLPKGVQGTHRSEVNAFRWMWELHPFSPDDVGAVKTPLSFVDSTWELFWMLLKGLPAVIAPTDAAHDPRLLVDVLADAKVTRLILVPSLLEAMLNFVPDLALRLPALRFWIGGGEALSTALLKRFLQAKPDSMLYNLYGTSEVGGDATWYEPEAAHLDIPRMPIGKPLANVTAYVLDAAMQPVPVGVPGQLYIGGEALGLGYLNQPAMTAEKFVPDPFGKDPNARLYKTGDIVRYLPDGNIDYLQRSDHQVKIRGHRVDPSEVEEALRSYPGLRQSAVVARTDSQGQNALVAYLVFDSNPVPTTEVQRFLRRKLPQAMIPAAFITLDSLPLTPSGKLDRRALPAPQYGTTPAGADNAPRTARQRQVVAIWQEMLGRQDVGIHDNFFDLGGHSLLAVRLLSRIKQVTGRTIPLATMFHAATVAQQAAYLKRRRRRTPSPLVVLQREGSRPPLFCVHAIQGGVFLYRGLLPALGPDQPVYALQARGVDERDQPLNRVEDMAAIYVKAIRSVQPEGPYYLCGYSFGGLPAYEIAQQLRAAGQQVAFLALIDTGWQAPMPKWLKRRATRKAYSFLAGLVILPLRYRLPYLAQTMRTTWRNSRRQRARTPKAPAKVLPPHIEQIAAAARQADATYMPIPYPGKITYFRAIHNSINVRVFRQLRRLGIGGVEFHDVPGSHKSIIRSPNVEVLGEVFRKCLEQAQVEHANKR